MKKFTLSQFKKYFLIYLFSVLLFFLVACDGSGGNSGGNNKVSSIPKPPVSTPPTSNPQSTSFSVNNRNYINDLNLKMAIDLAKEDIYGELLGQNFNIYAASLEVVKQPKNGKVLLLYDNYAFLYYTPNDGFIGTDSIQVKLVVSNNDNSKANAVSNVFTISINTGYFGANDFPFIFASDRPMEFTLRGDDSFDSISFNMSYARYAEHDYNNRPATLQNLNSGNFDLSTKGKIKLTNIVWQIGKYAFEFSYTYQGKQYIRAFDAHFGVRSVPSSQNSPYQITKSVEPDFGSHFLFAMDGFSANSLTLSFRDVVGSIGYFYSFPATKATARSINFYVSDLVNNSTKEGVAEKVSQLDEYKSPFRTFRKELDDKEYEDCSPICVNGNSVDLLNAYFAKADFAIVIANDANIDIGGGWSLGEIMAVDSDAISRGHFEIDTAQTIIHEIGHSFGKLDDEYVSESTEKLWGSFYFDSWSNVEHLNTSNNSDPSRVIWSHLLDNTHNVPGLDDPNYNGGNIGIFEGAHYKEKGYFRPYYSAIMRDAASKIMGKVYEESFLIQLYTKYFGCGSSSASYKIVDEDTYRIDIQNGNGCQVDAKIVDYHWEINGVRQNNGDLTGIEFDLLPCTQTKLTVPTLVFTDKTGMLSDKAEYKVVSGNREDSFYSHNVYNTKFDDPLDRNGLKVLPANHVVMNYYDHMTNPKTCKQ